MHEFGIVQDLIRRILADLPARENPRISEVRLRRGSAFAEEPLLQAFEILSRETPLEGARLTIEESPTEVRCEGCARTRAISADDLLGDLFVCPDCGTATEVEESSGLVLLGVTLEEENR